MIDFFIFVIFIKQSKRKSVVYDTLNANAANIYYNLQNGTS